MQQTKPALKPVTNLDAQLPEHRMKQVEAGVAAYQAVLAERDMLARQVRDLIIKTDSLDQQLGSLQGVINLMESAFNTSKADLEGRLADYMKQRDRAVAKCATLEAHLVNIQSTLNNALVNEPAS